MSTLLYPFSILWRIYFALVFCVTFVSFYPVFFILLSKEEWYKYAFTLKRFVSKITVTLSGVKLKVDEQFALQPNVPMVICPNHQSMLDIIALYCLFPNYFVFMGKHQLKKIPLFKIFFKDMDIAVDRTSRMGAHRAWLRAAEELNKNRSVVMFPEGTIPCNVPTLLPFKNGPFKLAIEKQVPIVPVTFINNYKLFPELDQKGHDGGPGIAYAVIHAPIDTKGMTDQNLVHLRTQVFNTINDTLQENENRQLYGRQAG